MAKARINDQYAPGNLLSQAYQHLANNSTIVEDLSRVLHGQAILAANYNGRTLGKETLSIGAADNNANAMLMQVLQGLGGGKPAGPAAPAAVPSYATVDMTKDELDAYNVWVASQLPTSTP